MWGNFAGEARHPIPGWDDRNHIDINIDKLTQLKIPVINSPAEILYDVGLDGIPNSFENGCNGYEGMFFGGGLIKTYDEMLDSLNEITYQKVKHRYRSKLMVFTIIPIVKTYTQDLF